MKTIDFETISSAVQRLCADAAVYYNADMQVALQNAYARETYPMAKEMLQQMLQNIAVAQEKNIPICQDTGLAIVFVQLGTNVHLACDLYQAINDGVRKGYQNAFLRASVLDPLTRVPTGDNAPAVVHVQLMPGDTLKITVAPKGAGSENMCKTAMLKPFEGVQGVQDFVLHCVESAGGSPCPPVVVGVGIGGSLEKACLLSKEALLRKVGTLHPNTEIAAIEQEMLTQINRLGIGAQGFGGDTTALAVHIETFPTHIACLPVAVSLQCHVARHKEVVL